MDSERHGVTITLTFYVTKASTASRGFGSIEFGLSTARLAGISYFAVWIR